MMTYDRNRNAITTGSRVMISGTGQFGVIKAIHSDGLNAEQVRRGKTVEVEGCEGKFEPIELIRPGCTKLRPTCRRGRRHVIALKPGGVLSNRGLRAFCSNV